MGDVGHTVRVQEIASNAAGPSAPATSAQSAIVTAAPRAPVNLRPPTISGIAQQGQTLTASQGGWTGSPTGFGYEWLHCDSAGFHCVPISLATTSRYSLVAGDVGSTLRVAVVASNAIGTSAPATSAQTGVVSAAAQPPTNTSPPMISGTAEEGLVLTASPGNWSNSPTSYAYRWRRCNTQGIECVAISGARLSTYLLRPADVGFTLRVKVIANNAAGHSFAISAPTDVVVGPAPSAPAHVMVIVEENRNRSEVIGALDMPYLNSLANKYGNTTKWNGVSHQSLPNYFALISGSTEGVTDDGCENSFAGAATLGSELSLAGISWKAYQEELP